MLLLLITLFMLFIFLLAIWLILVGMMGEAGALKLVLFYASIIAIYCIISFLCRIGRKRFIRNAQKVWEELPVDEKAEWEKVTVRHIYMLNKSVFHDDEHGERAFLMLCYKKSNFFDWFEKKPKRVPERPKEWVGFIDTYLLFKPQITIYGKSSETVVSLSSEPDQMGSKKDFWNTKFGTFVFLPLF